MILAVDSSALILLVNPSANPPEDPKTKQPVTHARERVELFLEGLSAADTLVIPTPVLAEVLVGAEDGGPGLAEAIKGMARVKVRPFGERAAVETAMMTRDAVRAGDKRDGSLAPWQKVKVDRQVIAVARVEGANRIYADDHNLVEFARRLGMDVFSTWDLPVPEGVENLFTAAGVELDPQTAPGPEAEVVVDEHVPRALNLDGPSEANDNGEGGEADTHDADLVDAVLEELEQADAAAGEGNATPAPDGVEDEGKPEAG